MIHLFILVWDEVYLNCFEHLRESGNITGLIGFQES